MLADRVRMGANSGTDKINITVIIKYQYNQYGTGTLYYNFNGVIQEYAGPFYFPEDFDNSLSTPNADSTHEITLSDNRLIMFTSDEYIVTYDAYLNGTRVFYPYDNDYNLYYGQVKNNELAYPGFKDGDVLELDIGLD